MGGERRLADPNLAALPLSPMAWLNWESHIRAWVLGATANLVCAALCAPLLAAETAASPRAAATGTRTAQAKPQPKAKEVPKDLHNKRGISPFWEKVTQGDIAALAHDFRAARVHYQAALTADPKNPVGHLRLAEVSLKEGVLEDVDDYLAAALRFSAEEPHLVVKVLFFTAVFQERKGALAAAIEAWTRYKAQAHVTKDVPVYQATADARIAFLKQQLESSAAYEGVRARIKSSVADAL